MITEIIIKKFMLEIAESEKCFHLLCMFSLCEGLGGRCRSHVAWLQSKFAGNDHDDLKIVWCSNCED